MRWMTPRRARRSMPEYAVCSGSAKRQRGSGEWGVGSGEWGVGSGDKEFAFLSPLPTPIPHSLFCFPSKSCQATLWRFANAFTGRQAVRYGERQRPEHRSKGLLIKAQVADAPRTVPEIAPLSRTRNRKPI